MQITHTLFSDPVIALTLGKRLSRPAAQGLLPRLFGRRPHLVRLGLGSARKTARFSFRE